MAASASPVEEPTSVVALDVGGDRPAPHRMLCLGPAGQLRADKGSVRAPCSRQRSYGRSCRRSPMRCCVLHDQLRRASRGTVDIQLRARLPAASAGSSIRARLETPTNLDLGGIRR